MVGVRRASNMLKPVGSEQMQRLQCIPWRDNLSTCIYHSSWQLSTEWPEPVPLP